MLNSKELQNIFNLRSCGVLLHISSLPSVYYCGDLGKSAFKFCDFLALGSFSFWQILPINPIGEGNCPYVSVCSFAGEPLFIDLEGLYKDDALVSKDDILSIYDHSFVTKDKVDYALAFKYKYQVFKKAYTKFLHSKKHFFSDEYESFNKSNSFWLEDFGLFCTFSEKFKTCDWSQWPADVRNRDAHVLKSATKECFEKIHFYKFLQFKFFSQWQKLKHYCNLKGIKIIGDLPIFVGYKSSDVWANQKTFKLNSQTCKPKYVSGVPPDYFCPDGQLWGTPVYDWEYLKKTGFKWWIARLKQMAELFDLVRIDHFIGFSRYWQVPYGSKTARYGRWQPAYGQQLFETFKQKYKVLPFIAEDLGLVTPKVIALRDKFNFWGMRVLQFAFNSGESSLYHMPYNYPKTCVAYIGTHDNNTARGWYEDMLLNKRQKKSNYNYELFKNYFYNSSKDSIHWELIKELLKSPANICILQMQDILGLGSSARMNIPGVPNGNWIWRLKANQISKFLALKLKKELWTYGRVQK